MPDLLLSLDPSSTAVGYALTRCPGARGLVEVGVLTPGTAKANAVTRCADMAREVRDLLTAPERRPDRVVIEIPGRQTRHTARQGQATYGMAVGVVLATCWDVLGVPAVETARADVWPGRGSKAARAAAMRQEFAALRGLADPGMDAADAVALAQWWWVERRARGAA